MKTKIPRLKKLHGFSTIQESVRELKRSRKTVLYSYTFREILAKKLLKKLSECFKFVPERTKTALKIKALQRFTIIREVQIYENLQGRNILK